MLILFALIIVFYNYVISWLGFADKRKVFCGMVGYCGSVPANAFLLRVLLMYNNSRGGDSTGWAIDNKITKDTKKVEEFLISNKLDIQESHKNYTFIAHARKASSGLRYNKEHAHPFGIFKDGVEAPVYDLILAMNGTLQDAEVFGEEFDFKFDEKKNSDTEMLAKVIAALGPKDYIRALEKYYGTATLLFFSPRKKNTLMVYKDPQRPLFYFKPEENQIYISSMKESFVANGIPEDEVKEFEANHLYTIVKGSIVNDVKIERNPLFKTLPAKRYNNDYGYHKQSFNSSVNNNQHRDTDITEFYNLDVSKLDKGGDTLVFLYDKYFRNHHPATGKLLVNKTDGTLVNLKQGETAAKHPEAEYRFFVAGYMMKDEAAYDKFYSIVEEGGKVSYPKVQDLLSSQILEYVDYPILTIGKNPKEKYWFLPKRMQDDMEKAGGKYRHFLSSYSLHFMPTESWVQGKDIRCFTLKGFTKIEDTKETSKRNKTQKEIIESIYDISVAMKAVEEAVAVYTQMTPRHLFDYIRTIYFRMNGASELEEYFYSKVLLALAQRNGVIEESDKIKIETAGSKGWTMTKVQDDLSVVLDELKNVLRAKKESTSGKNPEDVEEAEFVDANELPARERIKISKFVQNAISVGDAIEEIERCNKFMSNPMFHQEMSNPAKTDYAQFSSSYLDGTDDTKDKIEFAIACLFKLKELGEINVQALTECLQKEDAHMVGEISKWYHNYARRVEFETYGGDEKPNAAGKSEDVDYEINDEDLDDDAVKGQWSAEEQEEEIENSAKSIVEMIDLCYKDCKVLAAEYRSPRIDRIQEVMKAMNDYMQKYLFDRNYVEVD